MNGRVNLGFMTTSPLKLADVTARSLLLMLRLHNNSTPFPSV
jgi:hypothetical protein